MYDLDGALQLPKTIAGCTCVPLRNLAQSGAWPWRTRRRNYPTRRSLLMQLTNHIALIIEVQGRQCWMFANIANTLTDAQLDELAHKYDQKLPTTCDSGKSKVVVQPLQLTRANLISAARAGVQFLRDHAVNKADGTIYFALDRDGKPALMQRKIFSATFMIMALGEVGKATGESLSSCDAAASLHGGNQSDAHRSLGHNGPRASHH